VDPTGILIAIAIEAGIVAEVIAWLAGFGWRERVALWIVVIATIIT